MDMRETQEDLGPHCHYQAGSPCCALHDNAFKLLQAARNVLSQHGHKVKACCLACLELSDLIVETEKPV